MRDYMYLNNELMQKKDGFYQLEKDKLAVQAFEDEVKDKLMTFESPLARLHYLIHENYYENIFALYKEEDVLALQQLIDDYEFKFQSFMAISKFYQSYALKSNDGRYYLERYEDRILSVALSLGSGSIEQATELAIAMIEQRYQPATP
ncbi:MAG TPA: ribonucleotide-diphosphate reductase subunit alpha, partial [Firmicutes bacterium]|nr:ribonucleotide-diphosphate reductase subunit alpha [Bacillota bacterium]